MYVLQTKFIAGKSRRQQAFHNLTGMLDWHQHIWGGKRKTRVHYILLLMHALIVVKLNVTKIDVKLRNTVNDVENSCSHYSKCYLFPRD